MTPSHPWLLHQGALMPRIPAPHQYFDLFHVFDFGFSWQSIHKRWNQIRHGSSARLPSLGFFLSGGVHLLSSVCALKLGFSREGAVNTGGISTSCLIF